MSTTVSTAGLKVNKAFDDDSFSEWCARLGHPSDSQSVYSLQEEVGKWVPAFDGMGNNGFVYRFWAERESFSDTELDVSVLDILSITDKLPPDLLLLGVSVYCFDYYNGSDSPFFFENDNS